MLHLSRKYRLSTRLFVYTIGFLFAIMTLFSFLTIITMRTQTETIYTTASEKYLNAKIDSITDTANEFVSSLDALVGGKTVVLNKTVFYLRQQLYSLNGYDKYFFTNYNFLNNDYFTYVNGSLNATIDRLDSFGYYDFNHDGRNDLETPGAIIFGDVIDTLTIENGNLFVQINASISGELSSEAKIEIYAVKNQNTTKIDITNYYRNNFNNSFKNLWLEEWNKDNYSFPIELEQKLKQISPDYLETYFLVLEPNLVTDLTISAEVKKARIEGCINGTVSGDYKGIIKGKINGTAKGEIDLRPKNIEETFVPLLEPFLNWAYFATPNYFIVAPYAPDYRFGGLPAVSADYDWLKRAWYSEILEQELNATANGVEQGSRSYFSKLGIDYVLKNLFMSLGQAIYNDTGGYEGLFVLDFNLEILMNLVKIDITGEDFNLVCNQQGDILLSPEYLQNISRKPKEIFPTENIYDSEHEDVIDIFNTALREKWGNDTVTIKNTEYVVIYGNIKTINWYMLHFSPLSLIMEDFVPIYNAMLKQLDDIRTIILSGSAAIITVIGIIAFLAIRNFNSYLQKLLHAIRSLASGDFSVSFQLDLQKQRDEFTEVLLAFEEMAIKLEQTMAKERESSYLANLTLDIFGHDIANYHQALKGYLDILSTLVEKKDAPIKDIFSSLNAIFQRLESLRKKVARLQAVDVVGERLEIIKVDQIVESAITKIKEFYPDYSINVIKDYSLDMQVKGNELLLDVFENLMDNSLKYSKNKAITFWLSVSTVTHNGKHCTAFTIADDGKGINDALKKSIQNSFETGYRIRGLGLIIVYRIIKKFNGELIIEDRIKGMPEEGTKITFTVCYEE